MSRDTVYGVKGVIRHFAAPLTNVPGRIGDRAQHVRDPLLSVNGDTGPSGALPVQPFRFRVVDDRNGVAVRRSVGGIDARGELDAVF